MVAVTLANSSGGQSEYAIPAHADVLFPHSLALYRNRSFVGLLHDTIARFSADRTVLNRILSSSISRAIANTRVTAGDIARLADPKAPLPAGCKLIVVEFLDYDCPFSHQSASVRSEAMDAYQDRVRFIVPIFPSKRSIRVPFRLH